MLYRLAIPLIFMVGPRLLPRVVRLVKLVWRLTFDKRVPFFLRLLVPLAIIYVFSPIDLAPDKAGPIGRLDDLIVLGLAVLFLTKLSPKKVVDDILGPPPNRPRPEDKDPEKVVDGSSHVVDDD